MNAYPVKHGIGVPFSTRSMMISPIPTPEGDDARNAPKQLFFHVSLFSCITWIGSSVEKQSAMRQLAASIPFSLNTVTFGATDAAPPEDTTHFVTLALLAST